MVTPYDIIYGFSIISIVNMSFWEELPSDIVIFLIYLFEP
jgi:hypothetical protein